MRKKLYLGWTALGWGGQLALEALPLLCLLGFVIALIVVD